MQKLVDLASSRVEPRIEQKNNPKRFGKATKQEKKENYTASCQSTVYGVFLFRLIEDNLFDLQC
jgi:hypothetical protein